MTTRHPPQPLSGVIEGFYGPPWSQAERFQLFDGMAEWGLDTYVYAPKDDLKHRVHWRQPYDSSEAAGIQELIAACRRQNLNFIYAIGPGLDLRFSDEVDYQCLERRIEQLQTLGCANYALLFDDIPDQLTPDDAARWGSMAAAQCHVANRLYHKVHTTQPDALRLFCPTPYCGRMAGAGLGGEGYLETVGRELHPEIGVFWTGPEIISREIDIASIDALAAVLRRQPILWDNLHANDYDGRRFYCGPYSGRSVELRRHVAGFLINPNVEFPLNYVPIRTLAAFVKAQDWNPRSAYLAAMQEWLAHFKTVGRPVELEDLVLFGDCYYLPYEEGAEAMALSDVIRRMIANPAGRDGDIDVFNRVARRLRAFCGQMTELEDRSLFHAFYRRIWDLREEMDLFERFARWRATPGASEEPFRSDFHLPGAYRGGILARWQSLLRQNPDGSFVANGSIGPGNPDVSL